jgi:hypothetical protein
MTTKLVNAETSYGPRIASSHPREVLDFILPLVSHQFNAWADFKIVPAAAAYGKPMPGKESIMFTTKIKFHPNQAMEIWSYIEGASDAYMQLSGCGL